MIAKVLFACMLLFSLGMLVRRFATGRFWHYGPKTAAENPKLFVLAILMNLWVVGVFAICLWASFNSRSQ